MKVTVPDPVIMTYEEFLAHDPSEVRALCFRDQPVELTGRWLVIYHCPIPQLHSCWNFGYDEIGEKVGLLTVCR